MSLLPHVYSALAFAEILMLFASVIGILVFAVRRAVRAINSLMDTAINSNSPDAEPRVRRQRRLKVATESGLHKIPGGHNERF